MSASYHIRFKCCVQQKIIRYTKKQESMTSQKKKKSIETVHERDLLADISDKDFKIIIKETQRTKGRCRGSQENNL